MRKEYLPTRNNGNLRIILRRIDPRGLNTTIARHIEHSRDHLKRPLGETLSKLK
jgi:hypothetical protein